jgi:integrase
MVNGSQWSSSGSSGEPVLRAYKLTPGFVRRVATEQPPARTTYYRDQDIPRHYLYVRPPSAPGKPWPADCRVRYTLPDGRRRWMVTGNPRTMDLHALRTAARAALAIVDAGGDPAADRASRRAVWTARDLWENYRSSPEFARCTPSSRATISCAFTAHILPRLGNEPISTIDVPMARRLMHAVATDTRTFRRNLRLGGAGAARRVARRLSAVLSFAVAEGQLERNPLRGSLRIGSDAVRETVITTPDEYARLFTTMDAMVTEGKLRPTARAFIVVAALTGARRSELQTLTWAQVDLAGRRITLSDTKGSKLMKRGAIRTEVLSLPPLAAAAVSAIQPDNTQDDADTLVFPPTKGERLYITLDWRRTRAAADLPPDLALHSLRHSLGTNAVLAGLSAPEVQAMLRHRNISTSAKYIHLADQHRARLQDRVVATLLPDTSPGAEVHQLPAAQKHR